MRHSQRVHVGIWYMLRAQRDSYIPTLRPGYTPYSYMDPLGLFDTTRSQPRLGFWFAADAAWVLASTQNTFASDQFDFVCLDSGRRVSCNLGGI